VDVATHTHTHTHTTVLRLYGFYERGQCVKNKQDNRQTDIDGQKYGTDY